MTNGTGVVIDIHAHVMTPEAEEIAAPLFTPDKDPFIGFSGPVSEAYNRTHFAEIVPKLTQPEQRLRDMDRMRSEEHTSELQSQSNLVCRLLLEKKKQKHN